MNDPYNIGPDELRQFIERIETQNEQITTETEARKEIYAEAKARGYDTKILRQIVARRKRRADEIAEEEAVMEVYLSALGEGNG
jgi:uncharacterized protein (UPF0335 family)